MNNFDFKYREILKKCKFFTKNCRWFIEGREVNCYHTLYDQYQEGSRFGDGWSLFEGYTDQNFTGFFGELSSTRHSSIHFHKAFCVFSEFLIYDE